MSKSSKLKKKLLLVVPMHIPWDNFVNPGFYNLSVSKGDGKKYYLPRTDLPLGPISISAYLKQHVSGLDVKLIDFNAEVNAMEEVPFEGFMDLCSSFFEKESSYRPDFVGVSSLFSPSYDNFIDCGKAAKKIWPNSIIVGGGNIPTNSYKRLYGDNNSDFFHGLCFGEGEKPMLDLLNAADPINFLEESKSWITKNKLLGNFLFEPEHDFIDDLDEIPFFDYDLCDISKHQKNQLASSYGAKSQENRSFHIMTSRGCPFKCTFCASHRTHGRKMRYQSLDRVEKDFTKLVKDYGAETLVFQDDHLMGDPSRVYDILKVVKKLNVKSIYQNGLTLYALDRPMLEAFYDAGVRHLVLPVESGSEKVLKKQMRKPLKMSISNRVVKDCRDMGIYTNTNILIGMPGETKDDLEEGRSNLHKMETNWFGIACASPIVGSEMHDIAVQNEYISDQTLGSDYRIAVIDTEEFSSDLIQEYQYFLNLDLNFVNNKDICLENWEWAEISFNQVLRARNDHAFAHLALSYIYLETMEKDKHDYHWQRFLEESKNSIWRKWLEIFDLSGDRKELGDCEINVLSEIIDSRSKINTPAYWHEFLEYKGFRQIDGSTKESIAL